MRKPEKDFVKKSEQDFAKKPAKDFAPKAEKNFVKNTDKDFAKKTDFAKRPEKIEHQAPIVVGGYEVRSAVFVKAAVNLKGLPAERLPQVAFLGRSNVGKSSLMNALMGKKKLVKVSAAPGKTREINFFKVNGQFFLVDLPGVGFAKVSNSKRDEMADFIREYVEKCRDLRGLVYLVDIRHGGTAIDIETVESIRATGCPVLVVASKRDKVNQAEMAKNLKLIQQRLELDAKPLCVSSLKKTGLEAIWNEILDAVNGKELVSDNDGKN